jgi:predicted permease
MADFLPALVPKIGVNVALGFHLNFRILGFTALVCLVATLISGVVPALFWMRADVNQTLKEGGRSGSQGGASHRTRNLLVVAEVALAAFALIGAGLFVRSFRNARDINPGFDRSHVLLARFYPGGAGLSPKDAQRFSVRLSEQLSQSSAIAGASYADYAPLGASAGPYDGIEVEGYAPAKDESMLINRYLVGPDYFNVLRIPVLEGRAFTSQDDEAAQRVMIVNQTFARRYFGGASPLGHRVRIGKQWATIVGLVKDGKYFNIAEAPRPHFFAPFQQFRQTEQQLYFFLKDAGDTAAAAADFRRAALAADPNAAVFDLMPFTGWTDITLLPQKVAASMLGALGLLSLVLASVGLYSVMAYAVTQRAREIGIRMALGAQPMSVLGDVLMRGFGLALAGLAIGTVAASAAMRFVGNMLVNVSASDPWTFAGAAIFLAAVALLASYLPARRATLLNPMTILRSE